MGFQYQNSGGMGSYTQSTAQEEALKLGFTQEQWDAYLYDMSLARQGHGLEIAGGLRQNFIPPSEWLKQKTGAGPTDPNVMPTDPNAPVAPGAPEVDPDKQRITDFITLMMSDTPETMPGYSVALAAGTAAASKAASNQGIRGPISATGIAQGAQQAVLGQKQFNLGLAAQALGVSSNYATNAKSLEEQKFQYDQNRYNTQQDAAYQARLQQAQQPGSIIGGGIGAIAGAYFGGGAGAGIGMQAGSSIGAGLSGNSAGPPPSGLRAPTRGPRNY